MGKLGPAETVVFNGRNYRRYPEAGNRSLRMYYSRIAKRNDKGHAEYLHRVIYESVHGLIPVGHHVHHLDDNSLNNDPSNLGIKPGPEHLRDHANEPHRLEHSRRTIKIAVQHAPEWHRSPEGLAWHAEHGKRAMAKRPRKQFLCVVCGDAYWSKAIVSSTCSGNCRAKQRRDSGADDIDCTCGECGVAFRRNRYRARLDYCSKSCSLRAFYRKSRADVRPER